jgi:hypothetical protein
MTAEQLALAAQVGRLADRAKMDAIVNPPRAPNVRAQTAAVAVWQARQGAPAIAASSGDWRDAYGVRAVPAPPASAAPQAPSRVTDDEFAQMHPRDRLNYVRQFNQREMPGWKDPRASS